MESKKYWSSLFSTRNVGKTPVNRTQEGAYMNAEEKASGSEEAASFVHVDYDASQIVIRAADLDSQDDDTNFQTALKEAAEIAQNRHNKVEEAHVLNVKEKEEAVQKAISEGPPVIKETQVFVQDTEQIKFLTAEVDSVKENEKNRFDATILSEIDRTMKKYADILSRSLEGVHARLSQMETRTGNLENLVKDLMTISLKNDKNSTEGKRGHGENIITENQPAVPVQSQHYQSAQFPQYPEPPQTPQQQRTPASPVFYSPWSYPQDSVPYYGGYDAQPYSPWGYSGGGSCIPTETSGEKENQRFR